MPVGPAARGRVTRGPGGARPGRRDEGPQESRRARSPGPLGGRRRARSGWERRRGAREDARAPPGGAPAPRASAGRGRLGGARPPGQRARLGPGRPGLGGAGQVRRRGWREGIHAEERGLDGIVAAGALDAGGPAGRGRALRRCPRPRCRGAVAGRERVVPGRRRRLRRPRRRLVAAGAAARVVGALVVAAADVPRHRRRLGGHAEPAGQQHGHRRGSEPGRGARGEAGEHEVRVGQGAGVGNGRGVQERGVGQRDAGARSHGDTLTPAGCRR